MTSEAVSRCTLGLHELRTCPLVVYGGICDRQALHCTGQFCQCECHSQSDHS